MEVSKDYRDYFFKKELVKTIYLLDELNEDKYTKHILRHLAKDDINNGSEILAAEYQNILGKKANKFIPKNTHLRKEDII